MTKIKLLQLHTPQGLAGELHRESGFVFNYTTGDRDRELALGMPIRAKSYASQVLPPILEMNRPEGFLRNYLDQLLKHVGVDEMRLLLVSGGHAIGRVSARQPGQEDGRVNGRSLKDLLSSGHSEELFRDLLDAYAATSGVSGVQPKVLVPMAERMTVPQSELIVKSAGTYEFLTQNEYLCMDAARRAGIEVPGFHLSGDGGLFIMERFDRVARHGAAGAPEELHSLGFEDMVVVMNKRPSGKYEGSYENIAKAIRIYCQPATLSENLRALFEYLVLSIMVRNGDAHLKNFGFLYEAPSRGDTVRLAPLYDVVTTSVYDFLPGTGVTDNTMALKLGTDRRYPSREALIRFGQDKCLVNDAATIIDRVAQAMEDSWKENRSMLGDWFAQKMQKAWAEGMLLARPGGKVIPGLPAKAGADPGQDDDQQVSAAPRG